LITSLAVAAIVIAPAASAQSIGEKTGMNSVLGISPTTPDFVREAAIGDMLEIAAAKFAQDKGNAEEKRFAEQMVADHSKISADIKDMVTSGDVKADIPSTLDDASQKKLDKLRDAKASNFSSEYDPMQVSAHKDAVSLFERYSKSGDNTKLKDWAGNTLPTLRHHLEMAESLQKRDCNRDGSQGESLTSLNQKSSLSLHRDSSEDLDKVATLMSARCQQRMVCGDLRSGRRSVEVRVPCP
jgi:putative membrane protein